ncbi:MAG: hypothetical protein IT214_00275 [Chitinophagaceae bacterium]|nr:hypothetical protein [Chitinophagaceae bacterium]
MTSKSLYKAGGMFEGASPLLFARAKKLRKNMTEAEKALWLHCTAGVNGSKVMGYTVIRFSKDVVYKCPEKAFKEIEIKITEQNNIQKQSTLQNSGV